MTSSAATPATPSGPVRAAVVVLAGGMGSRMGADRNKVYLTVAGRGLLAYSLATVTRSPVVTHVVLVTRPEDRGLFESLVEGAAARPVRIVAGGDSRHASERAGIEALRADIEAGALDVVAVHDGARPFIGHPLLERLVTEAARSGGAVPGLAVDDTLFDVAAGAFVDRGSLAWVQTPQAFEARTLLAAHDRAAETGLEGVDTAEVVQAFGDQTIRLVPGQTDNIKVTYQDDLDRAEAIAADWSPER